MFRYVNNLVSINTSSAGGGPSWPWFDSTYINQQNLNPYLSQGQLFNLAGDDVGSGNGNTFMVVQASEALAQGQWVSQVVPTVTDIVAGTVTNLNTTTSLVVTNITTTVSEVGNLLYIANSAGGGFVVRQIIQQFNNAGAVPGYTGTNTAFQIASTDPTVASKPADANTLSVAPVNPNPVKLIRPYNVGVNIATTAPCGISLGAVTSQYYTVIQVAGLGMGLGIGSGTALAAGVAAVGGAAGVMLGSTAGATPYMGGGLVTPLAAYSGASTLQPFLFNLIGNC
jgi:hypothetical protein